MFLFFWTNKNFQYSSAELTAARQHGAAPGRGWVCDGASGMLEFGCLGLLVLNLLHIHQALFAFTMGPWPFDAKPLHTPWLVQGAPSATHPCESSGKVNRTVYPFFAQFFTSSCLSCSYPATQAMGEKKTQQVSLQYWFECSGKQESWVIGLKLTFVCEAEMTCKRWVTSGDRKNVVTCSELSRLQFSSSVYKILIGEVCKHLCVHWSRIQGLSLGTGFKNKHPSSVALPL